MNLAIFSFVDITRFKNGVCLSVMRFVLLVSFYVEMQTASVIPCFTDYYC